MRSETPGAGRRRRPSPTARLRRADGRAQVQAHLPLRLLPVLLGLLLTRGGSLGPPMAEHADAARPTRDKTGIPKNPGRRDLGLRATLVFPNREIVEQLLRPDDLHRVPTVLFRAGPDEIFRRAVEGDFDPLKMQKLIGSVIESGTARPSSTSSSRSRSAACRGRCRTSSCATARAWRSTSRASATSSSRARPTMLPHSIAEGDPSCASATRSRSTARSSLYGELLRRACPARTRGSCSRTRPGRTSS
jgi:hypothetical protein